MGPSGALAEVIDVRWRLIPREEAFFDDFVEMAALILAAARLLEQMVASDRPVLERATEINAIENHCDTLTQQVVKRLHRTFVTPIDREDIHALALALDDVTDAIDDAARLLQTLSHRRGAEGARDLARIMTAQAEQVVAAVRRCATETNVSASTPRSIASSTRRTCCIGDAVEALFAHERDPIAVIKWKEIFDDLEAATDRAEDIANALDSVVVKHA